MKYVEIDAVTKPMKSKTGKALLSALKKAGFNPTINVSDSNNADYTWTAECTHTQLSDICEGLGFKYGMDCMYINSDTEYFSITQSRYNKKTKTLSFNVTFEKIKPLKLLRVIKFPKE